MTDDYRQAEWIMMPLGYKDESYQGAFVLPNDFHQEWKWILYPNHKMRYT